MKPLYFATLFLIVFTLTIVTLRGISSASSSSSLSVNADEADYEDYEETAKKGRVGGGYGGRGGASMCPSLTLTNGRVRLRSRGRIAKFLCRIGFQELGKRFATCIRGHWNARPPICISRGCPTFASPANGRMSLEYRGALLNFACNPGFTLVGSRSLYCDGRQWNSTAPNCEVAVKNPQMSCDFEREDLCGWSQDPSHDFDWKRFNFVTPSGHVGTGPSHDHTLGVGRNGFYMYIEASSPRVENDTARLFSPVYGLGLAQSTCFRFWYHMYGATTGQIRVYLKPVSKEFSSLSPKFVVSGDQGNMWIKGLVHISHLDEPFQVIVEGVRGPSYVSDSAIDDVELTAESECFVGGTLSSSEGMNSTLSTLSDSETTSEIMSQSPTGSNYTSKPPNVTQWTNETKRTTSFPIDPVSPNTITLSQLDISTSTEPVNFTSIITSLIPLSTTKATSRLDESLSTDPVGTVKQTNWDVSTTPLKFYTSVTSVGASSEVVTVSTKWSPSTTTEAIPSTAQKSLFTSSSSSSSSSTMISPITSSTIPSRTYATIIPRTSSATIPATMTTKFKPYEITTTKKTTPHSRPKPTTTTFRPTGTTSRFSTTTVVKLPLTTSAPSTTPPPSTTTTLSTTTTPSTISVRTSPVAYTAYLDLTSIFANKTSTSTRNVWTTMATTNTTSQHAKTIQNATAMMTTATLNDRIFTKSSLVTVAKSSARPTVSSTTSDDYFAVTTTLSNNQSNVLEIFPDESDVLEVSKIKDRRPPPWTYMKKTTSKPEAAVAATTTTTTTTTSNVAAAARRTAPDQVSVSTVMGLITVGLLSIVIVAIVAHKFYRRNRYGQDVLDEDSDVRYLKDGEVRVEFSDLHTRYISGKDMESDTL